MRILIIGGAKPEPRGDQPLRRAGQLLLMGAIGAAVLAAVTGASPASGQLIPIKTVPVATGDQFRVYPSSRPGMGGAGLAVDDSIGDPFRNPALGFRAPEVFFGAPVRYHVSGDNGSGNSLPLGAHLRSGSTFGSLSFALQQVSAARTDNFAVRPFCDFCRFVQEPLSRSAARNLYVFGSLGRELDNGLAIGMSARYANLRWVSGIEHLYAGSSSIEPSGYTLDLRAGLHRKWDDGREFEALVVHNRVDMRHDVTYIDFLFARPGDPVRPPLGSPESVETRESNLDRTHTWGAQTRYEVPVADSPWRLATTATINLKNHPKIPNYRIQNIPRDPGQSWAFGVGFGVARELAGTTVATDVLYEPIWSNTWQEADVAVQSASGSTIPVGGRTIENDFVFSNLTIRMGVDRDWSMGDAQLGIEARSIAYTLDQVDRVQGTRRGENESWIEWTPTVSFGVAMAGLELRYFGRVTTGSGMPGVGGGRGFATTDAAAPGIDIIAAAQGPLTLADTNVWTHQVMVVIPVR